MKTLFVLPLILVALPALAEGDDPGGQLNPPEMGVARVLDNIRNGQADMVSCASGYYITKSGNHVDARELFTACAEAGWTGAMTWMSQLENNGLGAPENPEAAAEWSREAAERGDPVGQFNHGLDMIRGHGIARDVEAGRRLIDEAADAGLEIAQRMQSSGYDPDEVTPDADEWKYRPLW